jgi:hypothetical protein
VDGLDQDLDTPDSPTTEGTSTLRPAETSVAHPRIEAKGTDLSRWSAEDLEAIALTLNNRPRKVLGWKTPAEVFAEQLRSSQ